MGPFITAFIKVGGPRTQAAEWLEGFHKSMETSGVGQISEVANGDFPHKPGGCMAQAWSIGELLRAAVEDVYEERTVNTQKLPA